MSLTFIVIFFYLFLSQRLAKLMEMAMERHSGELKALERCEHTCNTFGTWCTHQSLSKQCPEALLWHFPSVSAEVKNMTFCKENTSNNELITSAGGFSNLNLGWLMVLGACMCMCAVQSPVWTDGYLRTDIIQRVFKQEWGSKDNSGHPPALFSP